MTQRTQDAVSESIEREVLHIVGGITKVDPEELLLDTDLRADLNVDSLQGLQIVAAIEKRFDIKVPDDEIDMYDSVSKIADTIRKRIAAPEQA